MAKRKALAAWEFNSRNWSIAMRDAYADLGDDLYEYIGLSKGRVQQWINQTTSVGSEHPGMGAFLKIVDLLELDPADFFAMEEK